MSKIHNGYVDEIDDNEIDEQEQQSTMYYPTCRFCGKQTIPTAPYDNQADADEAATITCDCYDARVYQNKKEAAAKREKNIIKLRQTIDDFAAYCADRNTELDGGLHDILLSTGIAVLDGVIASVAVKFRKMKVNINTNNKGNIVIGFTYSDGSKVEVL
jgi:hypothetical protein